MYVYLCLHTRLKFLARENRINISAYLISIEIQSAVNRGNDNMRIVVEWPTLIIHAATKKIV